MSVNFKPAATPPLCVTSIVISESSANDESLIAVVVLVFDPIAMVSKELKTVAPLSLTFTMTDDTVGAVVRLARTDVRVIP
jgi:hypothetical protein